MAEIWPDQSVMVNANVVIDVDNKNSEKNVNRSFIFSKFHAGYFRISISLASQALLWKALNEHNHSSHYYNQHFMEKLLSTTFLLLWYLSLLVLLVLSILYLMRCIFYFRMIKDEFLHFVGVNYMFTPWTSWLLLLQSTRLLNPEHFIYKGLWLFFVIPLLVLDVKIYGQWFTTEKRFLSVVANPTSQMSIIGNMVAAWAAGKMGWKESATCMFTLAITHYLVIFVTLYQRLSGGNQLPARLRPVYFLFVAAPSMGSLAWSSISGSFDTPCKMLFYLSLFLFASLICRPGLFKKAMKKFNVAWWAYSFPLTFLAMASIEYAQEAKSTAATGLMLILTLISTVILLCLLLSTALNIHNLVRPTNSVDN
ncbi:S-type anion channel SLAH1 [Heracleum sosnowskyi]|uniref:S-type anion channel SLAH1 n=1 Tax=Heracleum sosnowskyi TaxID=360622 RepID=A0AAD8I6R4_9APIA|nr:S-type anion channel SLAH1 [Heracleum sosnowskyi]